MFEFLKKDLVPNCLVLFFSLSSLFERTSTSGLTQTGLGLRFILYTHAVLYYTKLPQAAVLPGSDAGSDGGEPALGFII